MKILITGGAGFFGANLVRFCLNMPGADVTVFDSLEPKLKATDQHLAAVRDQITFIHGDLLNDAQIGAAVEGQDVIFHCAAQSSHQIGRASCRERV